MGVIFIAGFLLSMLIFMPREKIVEVEKAYLPIECEQYMAHMEDLREEVADFFEFADDISLYFFTDFVGEWSRDIEKPQKVCDDYRNESTINTLEAEKA